MTLQERIKEQRKKSGLSQEKVAELMGVSRQAVTKWENGQSAPTTENLFKLAEIFGTTVDFLLNHEESEKEASLEQMHRLYKMEEAKKSEVRKEKRKKQIVLALTVAAGYLLIYLIGRFFVAREGEASVMGWLFENDPKNLPYLYGWLLHQKLFWVSMGISTVGGLLGKKYFSYITLAGFAAGMIVGEVFGPYPAGEAYGQGHYGWLIWGCVFTASIIIGIIIERRKKAE